MLEKGPYLYQLDILQILYCIAHYVDINALPTSSNRILNQELFNALNKHVQVSQDVCFLQGSVSLYVLAPVCLNVCLFILSCSLSAVSVSVFLFISLHLPVSLSVSLSVWLFVCLSLFSFFHVSFWFLSALSVSLWFLSALSVSLGDFFLLLWYYCLYTKTVEMDDLTRNINVIVH